MAITCDGTITNVTHWSNGNQNRVNFKLTAENNTSIWVQTITKEQVTLVMTALTSQLPTKVHWSCNEPKQCVSQNAIESCGYISITNSSTFSNK